MAGLVPFNRSSNLSNTPFYNMLDDFFSDAWMSPRRALASDTFKIDVKENDQGYTIEAEMPGIKKDEIELSFSDEQLTISVSRGEETDNSRNNYIHRERRYSSVSRSVFLRGANRENIAAKLEDGLLSISVPKSDSPSPSNRIEIQ